jgi:hypothetical protein
MAAVLRAASPPDNTPMKPVRLREGANLRAVERSGDFARRGAGDLWFLGLHRGEPTIWFEDEKHFSAFLIELNNGGRGSTGRH